MSKRLIIEPKAKVIRSTINYFADDLKQDVSIASSSVESVFSYYPIDREDQFIEFHINSSISQFVDLRNSTLFVTCKVVRSDGSDLDSSDSVGCVNLLLHSLFTDMSISMNGKELFSSNNCYSAIAYIQNHLGIGSPRKNSELSSALYYSDTNPVLDLENDPGQKVRKELISLSKGIELEGPLMNDLWQQPHYIPNNTQMVVRLKRAPPEYVLMWKKKADAPVATKTPAETSTDTKKPGNTATTTSSPTCGYKIVFTQCRLKVLKHVLSQPFTESIERTLIMGKIGRMEMKRSEVKLAFIAPNTYSTQIENIFSGELPHVLVVSLIPNSSYNGTCDENPYAYMNHDLSSVTVTVDSQQGVTHQELNINAKAGVFLECFRSLQSLVPDVNLNNGLTRADYLNGHCMLCFYLQPKNVQSTVQATLQGSIRLGLHFRTPPSIPLTAIVFAQHNAVLTFDNEKNYRFL